MWSAPAETRRSFTTGRRRRFCIRYRDRDRHFFQRQAQYPPISSRSPPVPGGSHPAARNKPVPKPPNSVLPDLALFFGPQRCLPPRIHVAKQIPFVRKRKAEIEPLGQAVGGRQHDRVLPVGRVGDDDGQLHRHRPERPRWRQSLGARHRRHGSPLIRRATNRGSGA